MEFANIGLYAKRMGYCYMQGIQISQEVFANGS